jgi:hypothetical protein
MIYLKERKYPQNKSKEFRPAPNDKSLPEEINEITRKSVLV